MNKTTVIIGASANAEKYSFKATTQLIKHGHTVYPIGVKDGSIENIKIITNKPILKNIHTVTLYINPAKQTEWLEYIISLSPKRVIFNPATENPSIYPTLSANNIQFEEACTLVLLSLNQY